MAMSGGAEKRAAPLWAMLDRGMHTVAAGFAILGGLALSLVAVITVGSILARALLGSGLGGDYELVEMGCAMAVFTFLPYCQLVRAHAKVDFFSRWFGVRLSHFLDTLADVLFLVIAILLTWRLSAGALDVLQYEESTMVLRLPVWWGFVPAVLSCGLLSVICLYGLLRRFLGPRLHESGR